VGGFLLYGQFCYVSCLNAVGHCLAGITLSEGGLAIGSPITCNLCEVST